MKTSIKVAIAVALLVAGERLYRVYEHNSPVVREGQCIVISMDGILVPVRAKVLKNKWENQTSLVSINLGGDLVFGGWAKWSELREMNAEKVSCE